MKRLAFVLLLLLALPLFGFEVPIVKASPAYEDFTGYSENDPNGVWSRTSLRSTGTNVRKDDTGYVYKSYGAGHFGDFEHLLDVRLTAIELIGILNFWGLTDTPSTWTDAPSGSFRICFHYPATEMRRFYLAEKDGQQVYSNIFNLNVTFYLKIKRQETTLTLYIYNDLARSDLFQSIQITCGTQTLQYLQCGFGDESNGVYGARITSGYCENLDLQEVAGESYKADVSQTMSTSWTVKTKTDYTVSLSQSFGATWTVILESAFNVVPNFSPVTSWIVDVAHTVGGWVAHVVDVSIHIVTSWTVNTIIGVLPELPWKILFFFSFVVIVIGLAFWIMGIMPRRKEED